MRDREETMKRWDSWRKAIAKGDKSSWPRDAFESVIDSYEDEIATLNTKVNGLRDMVAGPNGWTYPKPKPSEDTNDPHRKLV